MKFVNIFKLVEKSNIEQRDCKPVCQRKKSRVVCTIEKSAFLPHTWTFTSPDTVGENSWF
jgi:hypothetical protein